ncbi:hypothetical protein RRG08_066065 [Elysia crispata]|uniref:Uncharacterized protein n=1 Tax=Elysia crispata TaxID=231223 RepID=A0AAE1DKW2_9GAST|nr:hypothetical protein RRG08_066065 [Elysia crispata]
MFWSSDGWGYSFNLINKQSTYPHRAKTKQDKTPVPTNCCFSARKHNDKDNRWCNLPRRMCVMVYNVTFEGRKSRSLICPRVKSVWIRVRGGWAREKIWPKASNPSRLTNCQHWSLEARARLVLGWDCGR